MSGQDELRPSCRHCGPVYKDGLDSRRLVAKNSKQNNVMMIASVWEESITGFRIIEYDARQRDGNKIITSVYCNHCGYNSTTHSIVFAVKRYIYKYQEEFGATSSALTNALQLDYLSRTNRPVPRYEDYLGEEEESCDECGNLIDDCTCQDTCDGCGQPVSECRCCEHCGADSLYCDCLCPDCGKLQADCECDA